MLHYDLHLYSQYLCPLFHNPSRHCSYSSYMYKQNAQVDEDGAEDGLMVPSSLTFFRPGLINNLTSSAAPISLVHLLVQS